MKREALYLNRPPTIREPILPLEQTWGGRQGKLRRPGQRRRPLRELAQRISIAARRKGES